MDHLSAARTFVEIADRGSLTAAAEALDLSRAMVSRHLEAMERWLGARLLHRTTRRVSLSDTGQEVLPRLRQMIELAADVQDVAGARRDHATGKLRVTTSHSFAVSVLTPAVVAFQDKYPGIQVEVLAVDRSVDLVTDRIDLAVRITNRVDDALVARRLATCHSALCASPAYLKRRGRPERPEDLKSHACITHSFGSRAEYRLWQDGRERRIPVTGRFSCDETGVLRQAALSGSGIAMLPTYFIVDDLRSGALVRLLPDFEPERLGVFAVYLSRRLQPRPLQLLIDFLAERFLDDSEIWDQPLQGATAAASVRSRRKS